MTEDKDMTKEQTVEATENADTAKSPDIREADPAEGSKLKQGAEAGTEASQQDAAAETEASDKTGADEQSTDAAADSSKADISDADEADGNSDADAATDSADGQDNEASAKTDKKDKQIEELNDKYKRLFAEFDNFRKRSEAEKTGMFAEGERTVLLKVLPLIDNFERAMDSIPEEQKGTALAEGIDKTYKAFLTQLTELGVTPIEAAGKSFDANLHNAVMHVEDDSVEDNIVVEEFQKGYMFKDKVLRYSMVKVAN